MSSIQTTIDQIMSTPVSGPPLTVLREKRRKIVAAVNGLLALPEAEQRNLLASESRGLDYAKAKADSLGDRIAELENEETRAVAAGGAMVAQGLAGTTQHDGWHVTGGGETYHRGNNSPSFFKDLRYAQLGDANASDRLRRNNTEVGLESRALGNTGAVGGSGGEFMPPAWLVEDFVKLARPGRVTADLFHHEALPSGVSSVNLPRIATGTATAIQSTQNSALAQVDMTTAALSATVVTIGGKQVVSQQELDQSATQPGRSAVVCPAEFDQVILGDLAADYAKQIGVQALTGTGATGQLRGYLTPASTNLQTWTQAAPTASLFYSQLAKLQSALYTTRYTAPDTVVCSPRRWGWFASFVDSAGRPLVVPDAGAYNRLAGMDAPAAAGHVGSVLGMDVYTDPNIPTNLGAGTNQDVVLMFARDDVWLWESELRAEVFTQPYADSAGVLFRVLAYSAMIPDRYLAGLGQIQGTGLTTPSFAG